MSYCDPSWISDYTYIGLYNEQQINGLSFELAPVDSMIVGAGVSESGDLGLITSYAFNAVPTRETGESDYQVELLDASGRMVARKPDYSRRTALICSYSIGKSAHAVDCGQPRVTL